MIVNLGNFISHDMLHAQTRCHESGLSKGASSLMLPCPEVGSDMGNSLEFK